MKDVAEHNRRVWNRQAKEGNRWSTPATRDEIELARQGRPRIILTPDTPVPAEWLGELSEREVLCLASSGGQQAPLLAAAGARVTCLDISEEQLVLDRLVADREGLSLCLVRGDMRDLSVFGDGSFDLVVHVVSNVFIPDVNPVWRECYRVLRPGGELLAGFMNPDYFLFDYNEVERGETPVVRFSLPYSDQSSLPDEQLEKLVSNGEPLVFSHALDDQIGGQLRAGFVITGFFEDSWSDSPLTKWFKPNANTRARKP